MHSEVTLTVQSGRHLGATIALDQATSTLGRSQSCDIVLCEASIKDRHFQLDRDKDGVLLTAIEGDITVPGQGKIEPGFRARLKKATPIEIGDVTLALDVPQSKMPRPSMSAVTGTLTTGSLAALGTVLVFAGEPDTAPDTQITASRVAVAPMTTEASEQAHDAKPQAAAAMYPAEAAPIRVADQRPADTAEVTLEPTLAKAEPVDLSAVMAQVKSELQSRSLPDVDIAYQDDMLMLAGQIDAKHASAFRSLQQWFDESYPALVLQANYVKVRPVAATAVRPPMIQSVWYLDQPYIVVGGKRYERGDELQTGWKLNSIGVTYAEFTYRGKEYKIRLIPDENTDQLAMR